MSNNYIASITLYQPEGTRPRYAVNSIAWHCQVIIYHITLDLKSSFKYQKFANYKDFRAARGAAVVLSLLVNKIVDY